MIPMCVNVTIHQEKPIDSVAFCHSGIPAASMLGKRLTSQVRTAVRVPAALPLSTESSLNRRTATRLHAIYDKADEEIPTTFPVSGPEAGVCCGFWQQVPNN